MHDGLGDTIRVSLTEPPEEEIDPCRTLAYLGMRVTDSRQGVAPFEEKHMHYFDFQRVDLVNCQCKRRVRRWIIEVFCTMMAQFSCFFGSVEGTRTTVQVTCNKTTCWHAI